MSTLPNRTLLKSVLLLAILLPFVSLSQVKIKEKVEIKPNLPVQTKLLGSTHDFFAPPLFAPNSTQLTLPSTLTISGNVSFAGEIHNNQSARVVYVKYRAGSYEQDHELFWRGRASSGSYYEGQNPFTGTFSTDLPFPGPNSSIELYSFDGSGWGTGASEIGEYDDSLHYTFTDYLSQGTLPAVLVNATATVTGSFLPGVEFAHWYFDASFTTVPCYGETGFMIMPMDGNWREYIPCGVSRSDASIVVKLEGAGDYAYLRVAGHEGHEITTTLADGCTLVFDPSRGGFSGESQDVQVTLTGGGKSATVMVTLLCEKLHHFQVTANPRMLAPGRSAAVTSIPEEINNQVIPPPGNYEVTFSLSSNDVMWPIWWGAPPLGGFAVDGGEVNVATITVPADVARSGSVSYVVDNNILDTFGLDSLRVIITAVKEDDWNRTGSTEVKVKRTECVSVSVDPDTLAPGRTAAITLGTSGQYPTDQAYDVVIVGGGANAGTLVSPSGSGTELIATMGPVHYVAPATIDSTMKIQIAALAYGRGGSYGEVVQATVVSLSKKLPCLAATQSLSKKTSEARMVAIGKMLAENTCTIGKVVLEDQNALPQCNEVPRPLPNFTHDRQQDDCSGCNEENTGFAVTYLELTSVALRIRICYDAAINAARVDPYLPGASIRYGLCPDNIGKIYHANLIRNLQQVSRDDSCMIAADMKDRLASLERGRPPDQVKWLTEDELIAHETIHLPQVELLAKTTAMLISHQYNMIHLSLQEGAKLSNDVKWKKEIADGAKKDFVREYNSLAVKSRDGDEKDAYLMQAERVKILMSQFGKNCN